MEKERKKSFSTPAPVFMFTQICPNDMQTKLN